MRPWYNVYVWLARSAPRQSRRHGGFGGRSTPKQSSKPPELKYETLNKAPSPEIENMKYKHYKSVEFLSNLNVKPLPAQM